jgi:hypothetical protein
MSLAQNSKHKVRNIRRTISEIQNGDFPFSSGRRALDKLQEVFEGLDKKLDRAIRLKDEANIASVAENINLKILQVLPILGFILRSTNVRNAFELIEPLQFIANSAMQGSPRLILSSEWDFIPFAYPQSLEDLRSYVLIGLPASEAASALLVPLAGHELGHAVWRNRGLSASLQATLDGHVQDFLKQNMMEFKRVFSDYDEGDVFKRSILEQAQVEALEFAEFQAEELFCDLFAYALFGASYLNAFAFILAPGVSGGYRSGRYPTYSKRISVIKDIAGQEGVAVPPDVHLRFGLDQRGLDNRHRFLIKMADESVEKVTKKIWSGVLDVIKRGNIVRPNSAVSARHLIDLRLGIPACHPHCLGDIVSAGWLRYEEIIASTAHSNDVFDELDRLNELLLKTIEVLEFKRRTS